MIIKVGCKKVGSFVGGVIGTTFGYPQIGKAIGLGLGGFIGSLVDTGAPEAFWSDSLSDYTTQVAADIREFGFSPLDIF